MSSLGADSVFGDAISDVYERYLVPLIFDPYALDMASRVAARGPTRVLEIAAGTGVVTRAMSVALPSSVSIVATDLNAAMLKQAARVGTSHPVDWR
jgi:ubiquinone/menaquinone biosynthesis C-methylase UbiE